MSYCELLVASVNIIIDKVATVPTATNRNIDTSAPMEIRMAAKDDSESSREEGDQQTMDIALQSLSRRSGQRQLEFWQ